MTSEKRRWWVETCPWAEPLVRPYSQFLWGPFDKVSSAHNFAKWLSFERETQVIFGLETKAVYRNGIEPKEWLRFKRSCA